jgi:hypothetical protein
MEGTAFDSLATSGSGINRVQVFLNDRDQGGAYLADAAIGRPTPTGWQAVVNLPQGLDFVWVYARSSVTGKESVTNIPILVGL